MIATTQTITHASRPRGGGGQASEPDLQLMQEISSRLNQAAVCRFVAQLRTLLQAGLALVPALKAIEAEHATSPTAQLSRAIRQDIENAVPLADSLSRFPRLFSPVFVSMIEAAQNNGNLEDALGRMVAFMERRRRLTRTLATAAVYPLVTCVVAFAVVTFLLSYVVPGISSVFVRMNASLPLPTTILIAISSFLNRYLVALMVAVCIIILIAVNRLRQPNIRRAFDSAVFRLPVIGPLLRKSETARAARTLATLLAGDVPLVHALRITEPVTANTNVRQSLTLLRDQIERGQSVSDAVGRIDFFSPMVHHMLSAGQVSGRLEDSLFSIADMYEEDVETSAKMLTSMLEPIMLIVMGAVIAFIVTAIMLPILEMNQLF